MHVYIIKKDTNLSKEDQMGYTNYFLIIINKEVTVLF